MTPLMVITKIKRLEATREKLAQLERTVATELRQELSTLHEQYGFGDVTSFLDAVREAFGKRRGRKPGRRKKAAKAAQKPRKRAKITDATRAKVKKLIKAGKTGLAIAKAVGISLPSVQNIKKALGLTHPRKAKARKAAAKKRAIRRGRPMKAPAAPAAAPEAPKAE